MTKILPIFLDAFIGATASWSDEEAGAYLRLLMRQYEKGSIPNDIEKLKRIAYSVEKNWPLLQEKFHEAEHGLQNKKLEAVREQIGPALDRLYVQIQNKEKKEAAKRIVKPPKELVFPYNTGEFMSAWDSLVKEKKWRNKSPIALQAALKNIGKYAKNEKEAIQIIHNTLAGGWQGVFDLKPYERDNINGQKQFGISSKASELAAVADAARRISSERGLQNSEGGN